MQDLLRELADIAASESFEVVQIKQKLGSLRVRTKPYSERVEAARRRVARRLVASGLADEV